MTFQNVRTKPRREPMARREWPRSHIDPDTGVLHIELMNNATVMSFHPVTLANGVRLVYDSVGRLIAIDIAPRNE